MPGDNTCKICTECIDLKVQLFIVCEDCGLSFHASCANLTEEDLVRLGTLSMNVMWLCNECMQKFRRMRDGIGSNSSPSLLGGTTSNEMKSTVEDEVDELKKTVAGIVETLAKMTAAASTIDPSPPHSTPVSSFMLANGPNACSTSVADTEAGLRQQSTMDGNFCLLLSNMDVSVAESDVHLLVTRSLGICPNDPERIDVIKLVSNWRSRRNMDFVSFKVVLDYRWRSKALSPSTWPKNVVFREFINRQNVTWKPLF